MGHSRNQMSTWTLFVFLCMIGANMANPYYMVTIPAVLEAGAQTKFCASLLEPNETLTMTVTLRSQENTILLEKTSTEEFLECIQFQVPLVNNKEVQKLEVQVRGNTFYSQEVKKVLIKAYQPMTFIQTDKPIYLPGQTVRFRVVTMDTKFRPASQLYTIIEVEDPNSNRIGQWLNETSNSKILQLSYPLNSEAQEGSYKIIVSAGENKIQHNFKVEKYVLPKFDVTINVKEEVSVGQEGLEAKVCGKYTYGQPVPGSVTVKICRPFYDHISKSQRKETRCGIQTQKADKTGCSTFEFQMSIFTRGDQTVLQDKLDVIATVEEEGTGTSLSQVKQILISYVTGKLSFADVPNVYDQGSVVEGKVKAVHYNDMPMSHQSLYLYRGDWPRHILQKLTTDVHGFASFSFRTDALREDIFLRVSPLPSLSYSTYKVPHIAIVFHMITKSQPPSVKTISSLSIKSKTILPCDNETEIFIEYTLVQESPGSVDVIYLVLSRGAIASQGRILVEVENKSVNEGEVSFKLNVSPNLAPEIQIMVYAVLPNKKVISQSTDFSTEKCFNHKVSLEFSSSSAVPGEETNLQLTAQPDSLCGVSAIDQSVLIKEPGKTLDAEKIFTLLPVRKVSEIPTEIEEPRDCLLDMEKVGLKMATNLFTGSLQCFKMLYEYDYADDLLNSDPERASIEELEEAEEILEPIKTVRTFFPESWIWDLVETGSSGTKNVSLTVPDTITTWETETFCLSPQGFGLAPRQKLTVFQPFFLELTLPYSIIRGENFELKATVFNYLTKCIMVRVTAAPSSDYSLTPLSGDQYTSCLCANEQKTLSWTMNPTVLGVVNVTVTAEAIPSHISCGNEIVNVPERGRVDVVTRSLIVKAEGIEISKTYNWLVFPKDKALTEETEIRLPDNVIEGSASVTVSVLGDIMGRALKNIDDLLRMPYGCGEQNMALLAPNIYILEYLQSSQQLTPAIKEKASNFLTSGYQRQLNYKDSKGAYSTFGSGPGITWLTAFVLRSFYKAQSFVYIDPTKIDQSKTWLEQKQRSSGCFEQSGQLFHKSMKGGVSDEVTLSAYITAAFLEMKISTNDLVVRKSLFCLRASINTFSNTYTTALLAYVFTLAGEMETRNHLLQHLDSVAIKQGSSIHWSQTAAETSASLSVEISSYVLLAKLSSSPTAEDLGYASGIVRWLTTQQNQYGGFSSTQDTVVALQALSLYSSLVFSPEGSSTVTVQTPSGQLTFDVNADNKLLYQEKMLQNVTGKYSLEVTGTACASVQISLRYNTPPPTDASTLSLEVKPQSDSSGKMPKVTLSLLSQYNGKDASTNMVILDIAFLSGFIPDPQSLKNLERAQLVDRVEHKDGHVVVYLTKLTKGAPVNHSLVLLQQIPVQNLKPAVIALYDYYQPSDRAEREYIAANQA
ncbi:alpha-2-macroglobulin-like isoform X2 [Poecilia reticulata]|uniref:Alpha-2-macroglobulin-like n=1 Tax=Poecilia reticulata TaxID=8081 RepID=A0A3P9P5B1_POERE|nr:PREDICTED: alpha-2-macroglobulin-like isoform X2 [Poecilia reticulata]